MRVALRFENGVCSLTVDAEGDEDKALLSAFGFSGEIDARVEITKDGYRTVERARVVLTRRDPQIEFMPGPVRNI